ncbi:MAG: hypothetical protein Q7T55_19020, partial [Solirubrobacteraceae bacterium]|nr:hypothetical protein [Solirubrobacteraceae bacterium]
MRRWVEAGGHLVVGDFGGRGQGLDWVGVKTWHEALQDARIAERAASGASAASQPAASDRSRDDADDDADEVSDENEAVDDDHDHDHDQDPDSDRDSDRHDAPRTSPASRKCPDLREPLGVTPAFGARHTYATCVPVGLPLATVALPLWALETKRGNVLVRVPHGRGTVTLSQFLLPFDNQLLLEHDHALIAAAALQLRADRTVWLVRDEVRPPLLEFLWRHGAPAVLLGAAALAFALWRGAMRFGPRMATLPLARRSMAEQIRGTASFIAQRGSPALHAAQLRAMHEAAAPRVVGYPAMTIAERAAAIAAA